MKERGSLPFSDEPDSSHFCLLSTRNTFLTFQKAILNFPINTCSPKTHFLPLSVPFSALLLSLFLHPFSPFESPLPVCLLSLWAFPNLSYLGLQLSSFPRWRSQFFTFQSLALNWEAKLCESRRNCDCCTTMATQLASSRTDGGGGGAAWGEASFDGGALPGGRVHGWRQVQLQRVEKAKAAG